MKGNSKYRPGLLANRVMLTSTIQSCDKLHDMILPVNILQNHNLSVTISHTKSPAASNNELVYNGVREDTVLSVKFN